METGITALAVASGASSGMTWFELGNGLWGGSCCIADDVCTNDGGLGVVNCDKPSPDADTSEVVYTTPFMYIPIEGDHDGDGGTAEIAINHPVHSLTKAAAAGTMQSVTLFTVTKAMTMPAYLTTFRGKGGIGSSAQKLCDVFFQLKTSAASSNAIQALLHFYVAMADDSVTADADAGITIGYPLNTFGTAGTAVTSEGANYGDSVPATGVKFHIAESATPVQEYVGTFTLRMTPFWHSAGSNQVEVVVQGARSGVECWVYSSQDGSGYCLPHDTAYIANFFDAADPYAELITLGGMGLLVCKVGTTAAATGGETIFVPSWQQDYAAPDEQALPGTGDNSDVGYGTTIPANDRDGVLECTNAGANELRLLFGTDRNLFTMMNIATGDDNTWANMIQKMDIIAGTANEVGIPDYYLTDEATDMLNKDDAAEFDMDGVDGATWLYGGSDIDTILTWRADDEFLFSEPLDALVVCTPQSGSVLGSDLTITSGDADGAACTAVWQYSVVIDSVRSNRQCRWCAASFSTDTATLHIAAYTPPVTGDRLITGISMWSINQEGTTASYYTPDDAST